MRHKIRYRWLLLCFCLVTWAGTALASDLAPEVGRFLVAREGIGDPRFHESVILLVQHDSEGTGGVIINRSSRLPLREVFGGRPEFQALEGTLFYGGPVSPQSLVALAWDTGAGPDEAEPIMAELYLTGPWQLSSWVERQDGKPAYRVFTGYAGWAPGQLALEMERGDWQVLPAVAEDIFAGDISQLWERLQATRVM